MLFNSYAFLFIFLPSALFLFHSLRRLGWERGSIFSLSVMSLIFYGWWNYIYLFLIIPLMIGNFAIAIYIDRNRANRSVQAKAALVLGITGNIVVLGYFKYANFFVESFNELFGYELILEKIVLPLGISFFTFQKIAFLVDVYGGRVQRLNFLDYSLFVTFFPQLIAGPIVHHTDVMSQFRRRGAVPATWFALGITIFTIGLLKKLLLADNVAVLVSPQFEAASAGAVLTFFEAWCAAIAYTLQLYFDFSGYSDMAVGSALLFGIKLPINFNSPYKSTSIIDFWRRWHMTLSRFLKEYVYIPLGGSRKQPLRVYINLFITMLLGGLWHGAGWTFIVWGALHGFYLVVNHFWRSLKERLGFNLASTSKLGPRIGQTMTLICVVIGWVFFRSDNLSSALVMLKAMAGYNGVAFPAPFIQAIQSLITEGDLHLLNNVLSSSTGFDSSLLFIVLLLGIVWLCPNTQELTGYPEIGYESRPTNGILRWRQSPVWAVVTGCLFAVGVLSISKVSEFLYFQF